MQSERQGSSLSKFIGKEFSKVRSTATQFVDTLPERWKKTINFLSNNLGLIGAAALAGGLILRSEFAMAFGLGAIALWGVNAWSRKYDTSSRPSS